jgi:hypothetical protein
VGQYFGGGWVNSLSVVTPLTVGKSQHQGFVEASRVAEVDVLNDAILSQSGFAEPGLHPSGIPNCLFAVEQQTQPFFKAQIGDGVHVPLLFQAGGHAGQSQST